MNGASEADNSNEYVLRSVGDLIAVLKSCSNEKLRDVAAAILRDADNKEQAQMLLKNINDQATSYLQANANTAVSEFDSETLHGQMSASKDSLVTGKFQVGSSLIGRSLPEMAKYIPLRLTAAERELLSILDRALNVVDYTDNVDIYSGKYGRHELIRRELTRFYSVLCGLYVANGHSVPSDPTWLGRVFEVGRRYKICNPDHMRSTYVKMMYIAQDCVMNAGDHEVDKFPIQTVHSLLSEIASPEVRENFLKDPLVQSLVDYTLFQEFVFPEAGSFDPDSDSASSEASEPRQTKLSMDSISIELERRYGDSLQGSLDRILHSLSDFRVQLAVSVGAADFVSKALKTWFSNCKAEQRNGSRSVQMSLAISEGRGGARLSHSHEKQVQYVKQSLALWRTVMRNLNPLWMKAEEDILSNDYRLGSTGQGINRVCSSPAALGMMHKIVRTVQQECSESWIGSSVVHMGDHTVPNPLFFIDKYIQVPRILTPICNTIRQILNLNQQRVDSNTDSKALRLVIDKFFKGDQRTACMYLCADFFKHGFDGSGADNFYDAGSCIDGRLTSAWNWCSKIEKKDYFALFQLTSFTGFDGSGGWT